MRELIDKLKTKKVIGYGAGVTHLGTLLPPDTSISYIVDDTKELHGKKLAGLEISSRDSLIKEDKNNIFILVNARTTSAVNAIFNNLEEMGFVFMDHFFDCSFLHFISISDKLKKHLNISTNYSKFKLIREKALESDIPNSAPISGTWLITEILDSLYPSVIGDIAEFGVYFGGNSRIILDNCFNSRTRPYHLFDSFEGFPKIDDADDIHQDDFKDADFEEVVENFKEYSNAIMHKGWFENTLPLCQASAFSFVHVDCDIYDSAIFCIKSLSNLMSNNGVILFHDYWYPDLELPEGCWIPYRGVKKAVDENFVQSEILVFPETMHALVKF